MGTKQAVKRSDWKDEWSPEHPVQVGFPSSGEVGYLAVEAAVERLAGGEGISESGVRHALVTEGQSLHGTFGVYVLLTAAPINEAVPA